MYIIVIGGGKVGYYLTKQLLSDGHEVLIIEKNKQKVDAISVELGSVVLKGDGSDSQAMLEAGMSRADVVVAVTGDDEDNLVACQMAKKKFGVKRTIARINNPKNEHIFKVLGIDVTVSSTEMLMAQIERDIPMHSFIHLLTMKDIGATFVEEQVPADSPVVGKTVRDLGLPEDCLLPLIIREGRAIVPHTTTVLQAGDQVVASTTLEHEDILDRVFKGETLQFKGKPGTRG
jgi:trk system potassium uptake protein TrkA